MKLENTNSILIKYICHSLHFACSQVAEEFSSNIDDPLRRETYNWFHRSTLRIEFCLEIYKLINDGEEPMKIDSPFRHELVSET